MNICISVGLKVLVICSHSVAKKERDPKQGWNFYSPQGYLSLHFGKPLFEIWNPLDLTKTYRLGCGCWLMNTSASPPQLALGLPGRQPLLSLESPTIIDGFTGKESRPSAKKM